MMRRRFDKTTIQRAAAVSWMCGALASTSGCAPMWHMRPAADSYTYEVGLASASEIRAKAADIFKGFGYKVVTYDSSRVVYMETEWQDRQPADDEERMRGYEIVSRLKLTGTPQEVAGAPSVYHVLLTVENRFVPTRGTKRDVRDARSSTGYAQSIVKGMAVAFGGSTRTVTDDPRPF